MIRRSLSAVLLVVALTVSARAEETTADWLKKVLDPTTIDVTPFPGSTLNRKITVDTIRYDRNAPAAKRTAVYMAPIAQMDAAAEYFERTLGMKRVSDVDASGGPRYIFAITGAAGQPAKAKGLHLMILRSPWVDGMAQIQMEYLPPG